ncbi:hypothetical protein PF005_g29563 [Phytophthora fragariae]|uniref:Peroxisomal membrane protein PEX16 n=1 Tax=Phytophthora fragariae TaxID=53985 RepID=A0A6A3VGK7_9STRA|nr:hypothetical protein PF005_g29563 [Phytophthora fragariae]
MMKCFKSKTSSLLGAHEVWVGSHSGLARNLETTLYVAPQLVPKRVMEPEVATQLGYSLMGLLHFLALSAAAVKPAEPKMPVSAEKARDEIAARKMALILYLLRDPVLATVTKPATGKDDIRRDGWFLLNRARRWNIYSGGSMLDFALRNNEVD